MLEIVLTACLTALGVSASVVFLTHWGLRIRLRRIEVTVADWEERLVKEIKQRAAAASVEARRKLTPVDEAILRKTLEQHQPNDEEPWWSGMLKERER